MQALQILLLYEMILVYIFQISNLDIFNQLHLINMLYEDTSSTYP
jgi:hypothetical protein